MHGVYTLAIWTAKPGREDDFVARWEQMAQGTLAEFPDAAGTLVRDRSDPLRFISFGPWPDMETVEAFRASSAFAGFVARLDDVLEDFRPGVYDVVRRMGQ